MIWNTPYINGILYELQQILGEAPYVEDEPNRIATFQHKCEGRIAFSYFFTLHYIVAIIYSVFIDYSIVQFFRNNFL